eukprot:6994248-Pyramimonas_sp.AAC.1
MGSRVLDAFFPRGHEDGPREFQDSVREFIIIPDKSSNCDPEVLMGLGCAGIGGPKRPAGGSSEAVVRPLRGWFGGLVGFFLGPFRGL